MSLDQLKAFLGKVKGDSNLQEKLKAAKSPEDVVGIAKEHGHEFTADKIDLIQPQDLSDAELEGVSGGTYNRTQTLMGPTCPTNSPKEC